MVSSLTIFEWFQYPGRGGVREDNVRSLVSASGVREVHVRLTRLTNGGALPARRGLRVRRPLPDDEAAWEETDEQRLHSFVSAVSSRSPADA